MGEIEENEDLKELKLIEATQGSSKIIMTKEMEHSEQIDQEGAFWREDQKLQEENDNLDVTEKETDMEIVEKSNSYSWRTKGYWSKTPTTKPS